MVLLQGWLLLIDTFITDRSSLVESCDVVSGISDHKALLIKSYTRIFEPLVGVITLMHCQVENP